MSGCCEGPMRVVVEFQYLVVADGATCERCGDSREGVRAAVDDARAMIGQAVAIDLVERTLGVDDLAHSNRVLVNGRPAEEWLGGSSAMSDCRSCSELVGADVCCREVEVGGLRTESVSREIVLDAIMAAAGLAPAGAPGEQCCASLELASATEPGVRAAACCPPAPLAVTLVTGPGCG